MCNKKLLDAIRDRKLIVRVDANPRVGWGHMMRCIAVAQAWQSCGGAVRFVCCETQDHIQRQIRGNEFQLAYNPARVSSKEDAAFFRENIQAFDADWILIDSYELGNDYIAQLAKSPAALIAAFDDGFETIVPNVDLIINGNVHARKERYGSKISLCGPRFLPLRLELIRKSPVPSVEPFVRAKVLVSVGGSQQPALIAGILNSVRECFVSRQLGCEIRLLLGNSSIENLDVDFEGMRADDIDLVALAPTVQLLNEYQHADIAIAAAGSTVYELLHHGVPCVAFVLAENQMPSANYLKERDYLMLALSPVEDGGKSLIESIEGLLDSAEQRANFRERGLELVDGHGAERVAHRMGIEPLALQPVTLNDARPLFELRNDSSVRENSLVGDALSWPDHIKWLRQKVTDPSCRFWKIVSVNRLAGEFIFWGQVRFDLNAGLTTAVISISLQPECRGLGVAKAAIECGIERISAEISTLQSILAEIRLGNTASIQAFEQCGFEKLAHSNNESGESVASWSRQVSRNR